MQVGDNMIDCSDAMVLESLGGGELAFHLLKDGAFTESTSRAFILQMVSAVKHMHENVGMLHRDLKPWNIVFSDDLTSLKLIDFGLATPLHP